MPVVNDLEDGFYDVWIAYRGGQYQIGHVNVGVIFLFIEIPHGTHILRGQILIDFSFLSQEHLMLIG